MENVFNITKRSVISNSSDPGTSFIKYIRHDVNQRKGAAIHTGIAMATGKYLLERMPAPNTRAGTIPC